MTELVWVAAMCWPVEACFHKGMQLLGLGAPKDAAGSVGIATCLCVCWPTLFLVR